MMATTERSKNSISSLLSCSPTASPTPTTSPSSSYYNSPLSTLTLVTVPSSSSFAKSEDPSTALVMLKERLQLSNEGTQTKPDTTSKSNPAIDLTSNTSKEGEHLQKCSSSGSASPSPRASPSPAVLPSSRSISPSNTIMVCVPSKKLIFESAGTYGLQRNVPFLLRNSTIWRPGALPTPTSPNPTTGITSSQFEYVRLNFPTTLCSVDEVTKRSRSSRSQPRALASPSSSPSLIKPGLHTAILDMKIECQVFVVKDGVREKEASNEVKEVFVVREHHQKMVRRGEELQISVRFHKLPSDFISSSREFIFSIKMYKMNTSPALPSSPLSKGANEEEFIFESDIILHSKSRTKPGQSAREAAAEREANRLLTQTTTSSSDYPRSPVTSSMNNLSISSPKAPLHSTWRSNSLSPESCSPSPNTSPRRIVIPSATKLSFSSSSVPLSTSPTFDAASIVYSLQRSTSGSPSRYPSSGVVSAPLLGDLCEEADRVSKRARISSLLNNSSDSIPTPTIRLNDTRTEEEEEESRKHWIKFLQQVGLEQPEKAASMLVREKLEISQLPSLRFEVLRSLGFLVGDILRMIDHSTSYIKENPSISASNVSVNQISNQISSIHLNKSNNALSISHFPDSISPSPSTSPRTTGYETNEGSNKHHEVSRNADDEIEDGDEGGLQIDDNPERDDPTPVAIISNEDRKDKESLTSEYSGDEAEEVENERKRRRSAFHVHPSREQLEIFDVQEALIKLSNSPPPTRFQPIKTQASLLRTSARSSLSSSSSSISTPTASNPVANLPSGKVSTQLRETIKIVQRFADKMVSKISNVNNLDQELVDRSKEMANVVSHLEACLALSSPPAKPYTLEEIESVSQRIGGNQKSLHCSSDSIDSPRLSSVALRSSASQIHNSCSDNDSTDGDYDMDEGDSDTENLDAFQPLAYYVGVIKAHLELRRPDANRKTSGIKRDVLKKEYVLVPIEEASRVLGISTTKLSRAYKGTSILSRCGWVFKGRKRRLRWPTRPLRVLLKYICEKYLCEMANSYVSMESDKRQQPLHNLAKIPRSHSLDHLLI